MTARLRRSILAAGAIAAVTLCAWTAAWAQTTAPDVATGSGKVGGTWPAATITSPDGTIYQLAPDEKAKSLFGVMRGEQVEVRGAVSEAEGGKLLKVAGYTDPKVNAGHELWRRMRCNACVVLPATVNAGTPKDLHGATPVTGREWSYKTRFQAWTRDDASLWLATDSEIVQVDLAKAAVVKTFGRPEGLADQWVYQLASDGKTLWIVHRGGVAAMAIGSGKIVELPQLKAKFARVVLAGATVGVIADSGTFRLTGPDDVPHQLPALPTAARIAKLVDDGVWTPHWERRTGHLIAAPVVLGRSLFVSSYGDIYQLADDRWTKVAENAGLPQAAAGRLWYLTSKGLAEYDPKSGASKTHEPPADCRGRYNLLCLTERAAWVAAEPAPPSPQSPGEKSADGGIARMDLTSGEWQGWNKIDGAPADHVACIRQADDGAVWAATAEGGYSEKVAHPGMTYVKRKVFVPSGLSLRRFDEKAAKWESHPLPIAPLESRLICGQDGSRGQDNIVTQSIDDLCVTADRVFGATRLVPTKYFGGYWPCVDQVAARKDGQWAAAIEHHPEQLDLQGEQPLVLNISNGELIAENTVMKDLLFEAVGHNTVLGMFVHGGRAWAVTDGCVGVFDPAAGQWRKAAEAEFRFCWRATAAMDDGKFLYVGSDRGLVCRLELATGRFEPMVVLAGRSISQIVKDGRGRILVGSIDGPLGLLPAQLIGRLAPMDAEAVALDGGKWTKIDPKELPPADAKPAWIFRKLDKPTMMDKSDGNWLCKVSDGSAVAAPAYYYVKEVFFPKFLCESADGRRIWLSTFSGLLRLDVSPPPATGRDK